MFTDLITKLDGLRSRTARFRRVALHVHSPDSHDWACPQHADSERNHRSRFAGTDGLKNYAEELSPHVDLVAVTDHMRCGFAHQLCSHAASDGRLAVLPGMEVNINLYPFSAFRIHVLAILPEGSSPEVFSRLFHGQSHILDDARRTGQEEVRDLPLPDWVQRVHAENGICIAAHVENQQGVRYRFRQAGRELLQLFHDGDLSLAESECDIPDDFRKYLLESKIDAIEIRKAGEERHYRWVSEANGRHHSVAALLTFDAHCVEDFAQPERRTHIKMTTMGIKGLREAFTFPDTRIRFANNLPDSPLPRLLGIQISGTPSAFFEDVTVAVAENLNCIIGVRGSGKSTLVESLRYAFGYNRSLNEIPRLSDSILDLQKKNLAESVIRVAYRTASGDDRVLVATYDPKAPYSTKVYNTAGDFLEVADVEATGEFPLRLFGWSEIENLGRDPARQRDLLDRLVKDLRPLLIERTECRNELVKNQALVKTSIVELNTQFSREDGLIRRYTEYKADFEKQNTEEVRSIFGALDRAKAKKVLLDHLSASVETVRVDVTSQLPLDFATGITELLENADEELKRWWTDTASNVLQLLAAQGGVQRALNDAVAQLRDFQTRIAAQASQLTAEIEELEKGLQSQFAADDSMHRIIDLRTNAANRLQRASVIRTDYLAALQNLNRLLDERDETAVKLIDVQQRIGDLRQRENYTHEATLNRFLPDWMKVTIDFRHGGDTQEVAEKLQSIFKGRGHQPKRIRQIVERNTNPAEFGRMCRSGSCDTLVGIEGSLDDEKTFEFSAEDAEVCAATIRPFEHDDAADVDVLTQNGNSLQAILELQETPWDDYEAILLNGGPVNEKSPGQRSSAMLPLIALAETTPLVIDQPEDNLDKRLVGTVLMNVLAELKERRQIIVCTHDPNIVVGGDAEQVIVLEAESDRRGSVLRHGSIDNPDIVETIINLLEGGAEAFENRKRRYNLQIA